jgi:hypothetical protein
LDGFAASSTCTTGSVKIASTAASFLESRPAKAELRRARKRIRELAMHVEILTNASKFLAEERPHPKGFTR